MGFVKPITGVGITTRVAMESADLGIVRWDYDRGAYAIMYGDNFEFWRLTGEWQSPSIVMYSKDFDVLGVPTPDGIDANGRRKQLWDYPHGNEDYSTILPCDFIRIGDMWYVAAMVTQGLGNEKRTVFWQSKNLYDWEKTNPYVRLDHKDPQGRPVGHPGNVMLTFDQIGDYVYIFGTNGLARDRPIWMWRCKAGQFPQEPWEPWGMDQVGWAWGNANERFPILAGQYGELCFRYIQGQCVLSFFDIDRYTCSAITVEKPEDYWPGGHRVDYASGQQFSQLYGGYISPNSRLNEPGGMEFLVSQWDTSDNDPYHVCQFNDTLQAMSALKPQPPLSTKPPKEKPPVIRPPKPPKEKPVPPFPKPPAPPVVPTDPQALYELLLRELSASGSTLIVTPEGDTLTMREAIEQIFWKERGEHGLEGGRPRHPGEVDDQLGHVLNARAEGLFTQACVVAIAEHLGIDVEKLYNDVQESLK